MNIEKRAVFVILALILFAVPILSGCEEDNMNTPKPTPKFSELVEDGNLNNLILTIYYMDFNSRTRAPVRLSNLVGGAYDCKVVVTGGDLAEHRYLLSRLVNAELVSVENEFFVDARLYYVFEHEEYGELFNFLAFGGRYEDDGTAISCVFVNGQEVEYNSVFFEMIVPFLSEYAAETIERYLDAMSKQE
jgi:hypothetical protein